MEGSTLQTQGNKPKRWTWARGYSVFSQEESTALKGWTKTKMRGIKKETERITVHVRVCTKSQAAFA